MIMHLLIVLGMSNAGAATAHVKAPKAEKSSLIMKTLEDARKKFYRAEYDLALKLLEGYLEHGKIDKKTKPILHFFVISSIGHIYLRVKQDPDGALKFFSKIENDPRLKESEQDIVSGWISSVHEWKKLGKMPKDITDGDELFALGKKYYDQGRAKQKNEMDQAAGADFSIAASYLVPFTVHFEKHKKLGDALFMLGDIRRREWLDNDYWSENYYLTEAIRRYPNSEIAQKSYLALEADVHFGYTGSSGDSTPKSWLDLLKDLKALAYGKTQQKNDPTKNQVTPN